MDMNIEAPVMLLNRIIRYSLENRLMVLVASAILIATGIFTAARMEVDVFPDLTAPTVVVLTEAHGMAPEEVEQLVTFPVETAVNGAGGVRRVRSSSSAGISIVWVEFDWDTDIHKARQVVAEKMGIVSNQLPLGVGTPVMAPQSSIMGEIMLISVTGKDMSAMDVRTIADWDIRPLLLSTGGVSQVVVIGGEYKQYQILLSPGKMRFHGITLDEALRAAGESNGNASGGFMNQYGNEYIVRGIGRTTRPEDIGNTVVKSVRGVPVKLEDIARIQAAPAVKIGDGSLKGRPAVIMTVMKQPGTNTLELTEKIDKAIEGLRKSLPAGLQIDTCIFRQADFISASVDNIKKTLIEGSVFVVVVLFLFLMNWRPTIISLLAIPVSLLTSVLALEWMGFTINTMSLGGMAIAIGDLVDDAIIDVENVFKRLRENAARPPEDRRAWLDVVYDASVEIRTSVIHATLIIMAAFLPLFFLSGMEGRLLAPLGIAFLVSLFASLVVAITLTPVLCSLLFAGERRLLHAGQDSWLAGRLKRAYGKMLLGSLQWKKPILAGALLLFGAAALWLSGFGRSFLPDFNEGSLVVNVTSLPGISLEESNRIGTSAEQALLTVPEIVTTTRRTGRAELDEHAQGVNASEIDAPFVLDKRNREAFLAEVRGKLSAIPGASITIGQPIGHRIDHMLSGTRANIAIKIFGDDLDRLYSISKQVSRAIEGTPGLVDLSVEQLVQIPQVQIRANREMLARHGITVGAFARFTDVAFSGEKVSEIHEAGRRHDLVVRFDEESRGSFEKMGDALIDAGQGGKVPLHQVASIVSAGGPNTIHRENVQRKTVVSANASGRDQKGLVEDIRARIDKSVVLPEGYRIEYGGQFESAADATRTLLAASLLALLVICLLLYSEFKSIRTSAIVLANLPLALIGGVASIGITSGILSIPAIIGFITLFGIATRNGILLVTHYETLLKEGMHLQDAVVKGSIDRLSPILMTALTAGLALIPLAIGDDLPGNEIQSPMAKVILGGLLSSTLLNLFVVPIAYLLFNKPGWNDKNSHA